MVTKDNWQGFWYGVALIIIVVIMQVCISYIMKDVDSCDCTVNIGNQSMSVEDAFEAMAEGLSVDQADEVQIMINNSCGCCK